MIVMRYRACGFFLFFENMLVDMSDVFRVVDSKQCMTIHTHTHTHTYIYDYASFCCDDCGSPFVLWTSFYM